MIGHTKVSGPLAVFADGFRAELERLGYTRSSREHKLAEVAWLSTWLEQRGLGVGDICSARLQEFFADLAAVPGRSRSAVAMRPLLTWLRRRGLCPDDPPPTPGPLDELMERYRHWMWADRQLAPLTMRCYELGARAFLVGRVLEGCDGDGVEGLREQDVTAFLLAEASRGVTAKTMQGRVAQLRSLLRFLYVQRMILAPLGEGVPPVPAGKDTGVPNPIGAAQVQILLDSCDRSTNSGKRDLAILLMLARLGLRAAEVAGLELDAFDWRAGEVIVHGKGGSYDRMPLPVEVGEAVSQYLLTARPKSEYHHVFLTLLAPLRPLKTAAIGQVVWRQCHRAGIEPVRAHRLRHALATDLLAHGVRLPEIAQVLRQRDLATTAIYAKVDYPALGALARPWLVS